MSGPQISTTPTSPSVHWLVVGEFDQFNPDDDTDRFDVEHPDDCPQSLRYTGAPGIPDVLGYDCGVGVYIESDGFDTYFQHVDDPEKDTWYAERVAPGRWQIEVWSETHPGGPWGPTEYSGGLRLVHEKDIAS